METAFERYRALYAQGADTELAGSGFYAAIRARALPQAVVFERLLADVAHSRGVARVRRDDFDHITLQYVRKGVMELECGESRRLLGPGEAAIVEMTQPFASRVRGRIVTLSLGRDLVRAAGLPVEGVHGRILDGDASARVGALIGALLGRPDAATEPGGALDERLRRALGEVGTPAPVREAERRDRARAFIERHLGVADLTPAQVAQATGMSRATLFRAFEPLGGVSGWIQGRRLARARLLLATTDMSVADAGQAAGFVSASHLTSAFRKRWGLAPGAYRRGRRAYQSGTAATALHDIAVALGDTPNLRAEADECDGSAETARGRQVQRV